MKEIIRRHARTDQTPQQVCQDLRVIIDAAQQHALIAHNHAALVKGIQSLARLSRNFLGMIELGRHVEALLPPIVPENAQQLSIFIDAHGQDHGRAGADPDGVKMFHAAKCVQILLENGRGCKQGVPPESSTC